MARRYIKNCTGGSDGKSTAPKVSAFSRTFSRVIFYILLIAFFAVLFYVSLLSPYLQVSEISIEGARELNRNDLQKTLHDNFSGKYLNIIPKNNFLFISKNKIKNILGENYKKIRSVAVMKKFPNTIVVNIDERKALLVWCSGGNCFLIDENGTAYNIADFDSQELVQNHLIKIDDSSGRVINIGEDVLDSTYEQYVLGLKDALRKFDFDISQYYTPSNMAEEINVKTEQGTELYFSTQFPLDSAIETLSVAFKKRISEDQKKNIAYIDLRSENKIFYRLNSTEKESQEVETEN